MSSSEPTNPANLKTYTGGCHCGAIRYSAQLDLSAPHPDATKCNCSICLKVNRVGLSVEQPETRFKLVSPGSIDDVPEYRFGVKRQSYRFCNVCGVHCFSSGSYEYEGKVVDNFAINAVTLDQGQGVDFRAFKVGHWDGKTENWAAGLSDTAYPGGM